MSKSDNTQPYWVRINFDTEDRIEVHNHEHGVCDLNNYDPKKHHFISYWHQHCHYRLNRVVGYWGNRGGLPGGAAAPYRQEKVRHERASWRNKAADLKKMSLEDIYDDEFGNYQHRHSALWEAW